VQFDLSPKSIIQFINKAKYSLDNQALSLQPKSSDLGSAILIIGENINVKWKHIRTSIKKRKGIYALHLKCAADCGSETKAKLPKVYGFSAKTCPGGTNMHFPPINSILSMHNRVNWPLVLLGRLHL
jgi:hypothetical protein